MTKKDTKKVRYCGSLLMLSTYSYYFSPVSEDMRKEQEAAAAAAAAQAATQRRQQKPAEGEPENAETKPTKQQFVSEGTHWTSPPLLSGCVVHFFSM